MIIFWVSYLVIALRLTRKICAVNDFWFIKDELHKIVNGGLIGFTIFTILTITHNGSEYNRLAFTFVFYMSWVNQKNIKNIQKAKIFCRKASSTFAIRRSKNLLLWNFSYCKKLSVLLFDGMSFGFDVFYCSCVVANLPCSLRTKRTEVW